MTIEQTKKLSKHIFRLLKVTEITFPIARTSKGNLGIKFDQNSEDFEIMLDSVPLSTKDMLVDDNNIELKKMLEKYLFDGKEHFVEPYSTSIITVNGGNGIVLEEKSLPTKKRRGRPAKAK